jgi:hypothetical protein
MTADLLGVAIDAYKWGNQHVFRIVYLATLGFGIPGILCACFVKPVNDSFTNRVAVTLINENAGEQKDIAA